MAVPDELVIPVATVEARIAEMRQKSEQAFAAWQQTVGALYELERLKAQAAEGDRPKLTTVEET